MAFKDETLTFEDTKILNEGGAEVMMDWETSIMGKAAEFISHNKGDILEIGFGMGICADYIQAQGVKSFALDKAKSGAKITYWNNFESENNEHSFDSISFESISISPDSNSYMNGNTYYMPKVEL